MFLESINPLKLGISLAFLKGGVALLTALLATAAALAQTSSARWVWWTSVTRGYFPNKGAAVAAMQQSSPENAKLTIESPLGIVNGELAFKYTAPPVNFSITPWIYHLPYCPRSTEEEARACFLGLHAPVPECPAVELIDKTSAWITRAFIPGLPDIPYVQYKLLQRLIHGYPIIEGVCSIYVADIEMWRDQTVTCPPNYRLNTAARRCDYGPSAFVYGTPLPLPQRCEGNPCDVASGDKYQRETDYQSASLAFARSYHSLMQENASVMGVGWNHSYSDRLFLAGTRVWGVLYGSGYQETLTSRGGDYFTASQQGHIEVRHDPAGGWVLYRSDGGRDLFDGVGLLRRRERPGYLAADIIRDAMYCPKTVFRLLREYSGHLVSQDGGGGAILQAAV